MKKNSLLCFLFFFTNNLFVMNFIKNIFNKDHYSIKEMKIIESPQNSSICSIIAHEFGHNFGALFFTCGISEKENDDIEEYIKKNAPFSIVFKNNNEQKLFYGKENFVQGLNSYYTMINTNNIKERLTGNIYGPCFEAAYIYLTKNICYLPQVINNSFGSNCCDINKALFNILFIPKKTIIEEIKELEEKILQDQCQNKNKNNEKKFLQPFLNPFKKKQTENTLKKLKTIILSAFDIKKSIQNQKQSEIIDGFFLENLPENKELIENYFSLKVFSSFLDAIQITKENNLIKKYNDLIQEKPIIFRLKIDNSPHNDKEKKLIYRFEISPVLISNPDENKFLKQTEKLQSKFSKNFFLERNYKKLEYYELSKYKNIIQTEKLQEENFNFNSLDLEFKNELQSSCKKNFEFQSIYSNKNTNDITVFLNKIRSINIQFEIFNSFLNSYIENIYNENIILSKIFLSKKSLQIVPYSLTLELIIYLNLLHPNSNVSLSNKIKNSIFLKNIYNNSDYHLYYQKKTINFLKNNIKKEDYSNEYPIGLNIDGFILGSPDLPDYMNTIKTYFKNI
jgi:hypothetical protein